MPITHSKQSGRLKAATWQIGQIVNVGFMKGLKVIAFEPTPGDYMPDVYTLEASNGRLYTFTPHNGIERIN